MEYEGVVVEETTAFHHQAWRQLAEEEGKPAPLQWALKRASGMKAEQVCPIEHSWGVPGFVRLLVAGLICSADESCSSHCCCTVLTCGSEAGCWHLH